MRGKTKNSPQNAHSVSNFVQSVANSVVIIGSGPFIVNPCHTSSCGIAHNGDRATIRSFNVMAKELLHGHFIFVVQQTVVQTIADRALTAAS